MQKLFRKISFFPTTKNGPIFSEMLRFRRMISLFLKQKRALHS